MNEEQDVSSPFCQTFIELSMNLARMGHCMYQQEDGFGRADRKTKDKYNMEFSRGNYDHFTLKCMH
ncbi:myrcene synthase [Quercus suber]|uniref:Myrcene synthase n=1 Tax=Quercus suber TaxID=58331 RepID=A0AAW0MG10_QUESU